MRLPTWVALAIVTGCGPSIPPPDDASQLEITETEDSPAGDDSSGDPRSLCLLAADKLSTCTKARADSIRDKVDEDQQEELELARREALDGIQGMRDQCEKSMADEDVAFVGALQKCLPLDCANLFACVRRTAAEDEAPASSTGIPECDDYMASVEALKARVSPEEATNLDHSLERTRNAIALAETPEEREQVRAACAQASEELGGTSE